MHVRSDKICEILRRKIVYMLKYTLNDVRLQQVVVTKVSISPKLSSAKVYYFLPEDAEREQMQRVLSRAVSAIRAGVAKDIDLRYVPSIHFYYDAAYAEKRHIDGIFSELALEEER